MKKKIFITALLISVNVVSFSQNYSTKEEAAEAAKKTVAEKVANMTNDLLIPMKLKLKDYNSDKKPEWNDGIDNAKQFLYEDSRISDLFGKKVNKDSSKLKVVYKQLDKNNGKTNSAPTYFAFSTPILGKITETEKSKKGYTIIIPVTFQTHAIADNSEKKYNVTLEYNVDVNVALEKAAKIDGVRPKDRNGNTLMVPKSYTLGKTFLKLPTFANSITFLDTEITAMQKATKDTIIKWYAHLPETLKAEYASRAKGSIPSYIIDPENIKTDSRDGRTFIVKNVKNIEFNIEPTLKFDEIYYEDLTATMKITPLFKVVIANDFKTVESMEVTYGEPDINEPKTKKEKLEMRDKATHMINKLGERLSIYVNTNDKELKADIIEMFETTDNDVKVSHKFKNGKEKIDSRTVEKYLNRLNGTNLTFVDSKMIDKNRAEELNAKYPELGVIFDSNLNTIMYLISQMYESKTYKDSTDKIVFLNYNDENKEYFINKIEVVPNSTRIE